LEEVEAEPEEGAETVEVAMTEVGSFIVVEATTVVEVETSVEVMRTGAKEEETVVEGSDEATTGTEVEGKVAGTFDPATYKLTII